jgi:hypothetical protein
MFLDFPEMLSGESFLMTNFCPKRSHPVTSHWVGKQQYELVITKTMPTFERHTQNCTKILVQSAA